MSEEVYDGAIGIDLGTRYTLLSGRFQANTSSRHDLLVCCQL